MSATDAHRKWDEMEDNRPEDWGKAVFGHTEHWTEQRRIEEHLGEVQAEKLDRRPHDY